MALPSWFVRTSVAGLLTLAGWTAVEAGTKPPAPVPPGLVTGLTGSPSIAGKTAAVSQILSLGDRLSNDVEVRTQQDETVEVLWGQRTLIQVYPNTAMTIREKRDGQIHLQLPGGSVRVALAYGGPPTDIVSVQTPTGRIFTRGGIVEVDVLSASPSLLARVSTAFSADKPAPAARIETVKVLEGQSGVEPLASPGKSEILEAGLAAQVVAGVIRQVSNLPSSVDRGLGLAPTDRSQSTPAQLAQRIARVHVDHALEVERQVSAAKPALDTKDAAAGADLKGTVVATSLGVPSISFAGGPPPGPTATSPVPTFSPPVIAPSPGTTLGGNQSGGFNSKSILNDVLKDALSENRGRGRNNRGGDD
jgi:hypothetical protein